MNYRYAFLAVLLGAALGAPAAPLIIEKSTYKLTYADGWATNPFLPTTDSLAMIMKTFADEEGDAVSWTHGQTGAAGMGADMYVQVLTQAYTQGFVRTDSSIKDLGGKSFHTTGWRDTTPDGDSNSRVRIYAFQQGSFLFITWLVYQTPEGDASVAEVEAALGTLEIKVNSIYRFAWNRKADQARARIDLLGRTWKPFSGHVPRGPYFLKR